ncbi:MAG: RAMP superfamily CRISPR-associated protein [Chloroflexi bacterium]|nr:RAMP superfamily CRISPR-associated protein [Chloroflexota bacterium]
MTQEEEGLASTTALSRARLGARARRVVKRIIVEGRLVLLTPAHLGNGDGDNLVDMPLLRDPDEQRPLLTGASIAGALRSYLRERRHGYGKTADGESASVLLFGGLKADPDGGQSPLIVDDALGIADGIELRDGVALDPQTRTAAEDKLYDLELWPAGTSFPLRFELLVCAGSQVGEDDLKRAFVTALQGFDDGGITLGARKRRGYGRVRTDGWRVTEYDLAQVDGLLSWLLADLDDERRKAYSLAGIAMPQTHIGLAAMGEILEDVRDVFRLRATFSLDGSLLIRGNLGPDIPKAAGEVADNPGPDMVHIHSQTWDAKTGKWHKAPILSGTSLAGTLRARALKIANTLDDGIGVLADDKKIETSKTKKLVFGMFGPDMGKDGLGFKPQASRVIVQEQAIDGGHNDLVQSRVSIDRFTGGARETALFDEQPLFGNAAAQVMVNLELQNPQDHEIGLLLLLLKDLWTGDLPLGGEISVGRGRLQGQRADLCLQRGSAKPECWAMEAERGQGLKPLDAETMRRLEQYVQALNTYLREVK